MVQILESDVPTHTPRPSRYFEITVRKLEAHASVHQLLSPSRKGEKGEYTKRSLLDATCIVYPSLESAREFFNSSKVHRGRVVRRLPLERMKFLQIVRSACTCSVDLY
jgi:hypothetical protein